MTHDEIHSRILTISQHLVPENGRGNAFDAARERGWLDHNGAPTALGIDLIEALSDQRETRTVFRAVA